MIFNLRKLRRPWFDPKDGWTPRPRLDGVLSVLLHELAHRAAGNHLSDDDYFEAIAALNEPHFFKPFLAHAVCRERNGVV